MRGHYCQEIGHFIKDCRRRLSDGERFAEYNLFTISEEQEQNFFNDELEENVD